jgi:plastocyanin
LIKKKYVISLIIVVSILIVSMVLLSNILMAAKSLKILNFEASDTKVVLGDSFKLKWNVEGADILEITGPEKIPDILFPLEYEFEIWPTETKTYTLTAFTEDGTSVSEDVIVKVVDPDNSVAINQFQASDYEVSPGSTVELSWDVKNAEVIKVADKDGKEIEIKDKENYVKVNPRKTTTYIVKAITNEKVETAKLTVYVNEEDVKIVKFFADRTSISKDGVAYLNWKVENAEKVQLDYIGEDFFVEVKNSDSVMVSPDVTTTYHLIAEDVKGNEIQESITVKVVNDQAQIVSFYANKTQIKKGDKINLFWELDSAKEMSITDGDGNEIDVSDMNGILKSGVVKVSPKETTEYTLTTTGTNGLKTSSMITVEVVENIEEIEIEKFEASSSSVKKGSLVELNWEIKNASGCFILTSDGIRLMQIPVSGSIYITPNVTRKYTLIAYGVQKDTKDATIKIEVDDE